MDVSVPISSVAACYVKTNPICGVRASPSCRRGLTDRLPRAADVNSNEVKVNDILAMVEKNRLQIVRPFLYLLR